MKNLPIIVKILAVLGVFGLFSIATSAFMAFQMNSLAQQGRQINSTTVQAAFDVSNAAKLLQQQRAAIEWSLIAVDSAEDQQAADEIAKSHQAFDQELQDAVSLDPADAAQLASLQAREDRLIATNCARAIELGAAASSAAANEAAQAEFNANCSPVIPALGKDMLAARDHLLTQAKAQMQQLADNAANTVKFSLTVVLIGFALVICGSVLSIKAWVSAPLIRLRDAMERLSRGDLSTRVPEAERKDEVGQMARAVQLFKEAGLDKQKVEEAAKRAEALTEAERNRAEAAREAAAAVQAQVVESLADGLERFSAGDLAFRLQSVFASEYEKLRADFNKAGETLQRTMQQIAANAEGVRASAGEITQSSDDLSRRTEQQAASLEQTAAALDEITATVRKASEGANEARKLVNEAKGDAERSGAVVDETVTAMNEIEGSSKKISNIIGVIDEIAFQTNLLALNAGVEAARAGDAGRGFAVVATEVRALAQRSADAAKEIKALINASGVQVQSGVRLVNETGQALTRIVEQVTRLNILVSDIANSAQEQATGLAEVNSAVNQMDQVTQQNAAMVEQSTAASHALSSEADELARLVGQFRIGEAPRHAPAPIPRPAKPAVKLVAKPAGALAGKFVPANAGADDWDEF